MVSCSCQEVFQGQPEGVLHWSFLGLNLTCSLRITGTLLAATYCLRCHPQPCLALQASCVFSAVLYITDNDQLPTVVEMYTKLKVGAQIASLKDNFLRAAAIQYSGQGTGWLWRGVVHAHCCCIRQQCCSIRQGRHQSAAAWSDRFSTCACLTMHDWCWSVK